MLKLKKLKMLKKSLFLWKKKKRQNKNCLLFFDYGKKWLHLFLITIRLWIKSWGHEVGNESLQKQKPTHLRLDKFSLERGKPNRKFWWKRFHFFSFFHCFVYCFDTLYYFLLFLYCLKWKNTSFINCHFFSSYGGV